MSQFAHGPQATAIRPGELLRAIDLPVAALRRRAAVRQASLTAAGRSGALLAATLDQDSGRFALTITASTPHPLYAVWPRPPAPSELDSHIDAIPSTLWYDDVHGSPAWRRHMTRRLAAELLEELHPA
jgi:CO/xanthine dehydrogenase FAD-binding subunit